MYLYRLEIQGFKSFAQKTIFEFPEKSNHDKKAKSITCIVGPNGSGKSNVSDAIRWVLGEQSLKLIRCKKADDVIFGGSERKARQGFAEVSLYFNNEDKELPIDYAEVVITRRIYRNGETEYLINKNRVRLFDILMLLAKANFGQKSYSIIGQGMVDHIINISAFERKEFFDEATGVKQYQIKRDQAVNKLRRSRENLTQTNQILQELEPRLRLLTKQIKKLEKRKELETQLAEKQKKYYAYIWQNLKRDFEEKREAFKIKDSVRQELQMDLEKVQTMLAEIAKKESRKEIFNDLQKGYSKETNQKNDVLKELAVLKGKMSLEYVKVGKQNLAWLEEKKEELERRISEMKESWTNQKVKLDDKKKTFSEKDQELLALRQEITVLENNLQSAEVELNRVKSGGSQGAMVEAIKAVLRQQDSIKGIYGTVGDLAKTEPMYEQALAVAAGGKLSAIVVKDDEVAVKCIQYLKANQLMPLTFFPLNKLRNFHISAVSRKILVENGAIGFAAELLHFEPKFQKAVSQVFGSTIVVDTLENAKAIGVGAERMVTLEGDILEKSGAMKGGYRQKGFFSWFTVSQDKKLSSQEEQLREIAVLKSRLEDKRKKVNLLSEEITELKVDLQVLETKNKSLDADLESLLKEQKKIISDIEENSLSPKQQNEFLQKLTKKKEQLESELKKIEETILKTRKQIDEFNLEEEKKKDQVFRMQKEMQDLQIRLNDINNEINSINIENAKIETRREEIEKEISQELGSDYKPEKVDLEQVVNTEQVQFEISKIKHNLELIGGIDPEIVDEHKEVSERYEFLSTQVIDLEKAIVDLEKIVVELDKVIIKQFNSSFKKINQAFGKYFEKIFEGGKAKLTLIQKEKEEKEESGLGESGEEGIDVVESKDLVEEKSKLVNTGIEIMVAPPNKKINNIAILSGGERTMTALALICAIIESNPAPFIVMDEVDAALDESNSEKFGAILQELSYKSQFIVITHNRVIMHVADVLFGVAMGDDGVSKTLSLSLKEAKETVEK